MEQRIDLVRLKGIRILYADDLYDLGQFVLKAYDAQWAGTRSKARPTLHGLARIYGLILDCDSRPFETTFEAARPPNRRNRRPWQAARRGLPTRRSRG
jgi:hypothetical protein